MAFRLAPGEPVSVGLSRMLREAIDEARDALLDLNLDRDERVHVARRRLKRARSLVKVLRPLFGSSYRDEVRRLRNAAGLLSGTRDADVAAATAATLLDGAEGRDREALETLHAALAARADRAHAEETPVDATTALLDEARAAASYLPQHFDGTALFLDALGETYAAERQAMQTARKTGAPERFHDWRKRVKHRWHLLRLAEGRLKSARPKLIDRVDALGETLGLVNDCQVLLELVADTPSLAGTGRAATRAQALIAARRDMLRGQTFSQADALYEKSAKAYAKALVFS